MFPTEFEAINQSHNRPMWYTFDIYGYQELQGFAAVRNVAEYQIFNTVTPYDILHITMKMFVNIINSGQPLRFVLNPMAAAQDIIEVDLTYVRGDFWDNQHQRPINSVDISDHGGTQIDSDQVTQECDLTQAEAMKKAVELTIEWRDLTSKRLEIFKMLDNVLYNCAPQSAGENLCNTIAPFAELANEMVLNCTNQLTIVNHLLYVLKNNEVPQ